MQVHLTTFQSAATQYLSVPVKSPCNFNLDGEEQRVLLDVGN